LTPFSSVAKVMSSSSLLPIASPSFVDPFELALLEASCRAAYDEADGSNSNWSGTAVMTEWQHSNPPPPQPRRSRGTTLAERWMSL
jgi:hypothetical protein